MATKKSTKKSAASGSRAKSAPKAKGKNTKKSNKTVDIRRDAAMVVLFAVSVFMFFVTIIEGDNIWFDMHSFVLGVFGTLAVLWSLFLVYIAAGLAAKRSGRSFIVRCVCIAIALVLVSSFIYVYFEGEVYHSKDAPNTYGEILSACYD